jgi:delta8-fatty-acid desaturase
MLHVQITISHFPMPVIDGNPLKHESQNFIQCQLAGSLDVDCPPWMDWFHGGLQFQAVHHCITRVPRHNLRALREEVLLPFCAKWGLEYKKKGFVECNCMVIRTLKDTADKVHPFLMEAFNAAG